MQILYALPLLLAANVDAQLQSTLFLAGKTPRALSANAEECGTREYEAGELRGLYGAGESIPVVPIQMGTSENIQEGLPFDFTGVWWMKDNPVPEELLSFAGMTCSDVTNANTSCSHPLRCTIPNSRKHQWSWDNSIAASVIQSYYAFTSSSNSQMVMNFCTDTYGEIQTGLTDVPLIWVDKWPIQKINENQWLRPTIFQDASPLPDTNYTLTRILKQDGSPTEFLHDFEAWMEDRGRKLVVFDSDSDCKRQCMMWSYCWFCNWWCGH
mmetsp:Transcript_62330/g.114817  ORF Transcript_62330/g.114817 Transcript_62330/m.114817 type:complete len:268 (-) Transcript_62330:188-991(-)